MKAMLFSAGLGTRLKPFTEKHPKALAKVNGKTLLERNIEYIKSAGIKEIVINIHHFGEQIIHFLQNYNSGCIINISDEREEVLETGGGLVKASHILKDAPFLVMNTDILTDLNLTEFIKFHNENNPLVSLAVSDRDSSRKLFFTEERKLAGWRNYKTGEERFIPNCNTENTKPHAFSGIHIINPQIFDYIKQKGKFSIMTTYMDLMENHTLLGFEHSAKLIDVGRPEAIKEAEKYFK